MSHTPKMRVMVGMSGGVDSAVAALLLLQQGNDVQGLFMKNWEEDDQAGHCAAAEDLAMVQNVCALLSIPLHTVNFSAEYWERVFEYFLQEYRANRTPNPDVLCNREIKFNAFLDHALELGADFIATGHYARIGRAANERQLLKGRDRAKDQSYFLHAIEQRALERSLFPVGDLLKTEVRALAAEAGLPNHARKDSTGICFIGERNFREFLRHYVAPRPGPMRTPDGITVGTHQGLAYYTLGQREGLGIGGRAGAAEAPWYVVAKDETDNALVVAQGHDHPLLYHSALEASGLHWIAAHAPRPLFACNAKVRYRQADQACVIEAIDGERCRVRFGEPQRAMTPGQSVVFYTDEVCLGGGVIERVFD